MTFCFSHIARYAPETAKPNLAHICGPALTIFIECGLNGVVDNTDAFHGWSIWLTWISILAGIATIVTTYTLVMEINRRKTSKQCQAKIIKDLIRHFFVNNAITEVIQHILDQSDGDEVVFREGIFERFCVLDSDIELSRLSFSTRNYDELHELQLLLRNYNISCKVAEKHFTSRAYSKDERQADLNDIWHRSTNLTDRFLNFSKISGLNVNTSIVADYIRHHYTKIEVSNLGVREYEVSAFVRPEGSKRSYYDAGPYFLKELFDDVIKDKYGYVRMSMS